MVARLRSAFTLVLPDLASRGVSPPRVDVRYRLVDEVSRLRALLRSLGLRRVYVVGHSHGAALAVGLAGSGSEVEGLVLVNPVTPWTRRPALLSVLGSPVAEAMAGALVPASRRPVTRWILEHRVFTGTTRPTSETVEAFSRPYLRPARARALIRILADWNPAALRGYLPAAPVAGAVLAGARDRRTAPRDAARLAARLGAESSVMEDVGHAGPLEAPGRVARAVRSLADPVRRSPGDRWEEASTTMGGDRNA